MNGICTFTGEIKVFAFFALREFIVFVHGEPVFTVGMFALEFGNVAFWVIAVVKECIIGQVYVCILVAFMAFCF